MSKFKVGDTVVCVDDNCAFGAIKDGKVYTVSKVDENYVYLDGLYQTAGWYPQRFELATDAPQPQPDSIVAAFNDVHDAIATLSSLDRRKVIHAVKVLLDIP